MSIRFPVVNIILLMCTDLKFLPNQKYEYLRNYVVQLKTITGLYSWCTGTTQRDGMGREEGGGFRMGNTCIPVVDSF